MLTMQWWSVNNKLLSCIGPIYTITITLCPFSKLLLLQAAKTLSLLHGYFFSQFCSWSVLARLHCMNIDALKLS